MLKEASSEFKEFFILEFTKELIKASSDEPTLKLQEIVESKQQEEEQIQRQQQETIKELVQEKLNPEIKKQEINKPIEFKPLPRPPLMVPRRRMLNIPESTLPQRLQYIQPVPTQRQLNLGKLNGLIKDMTVKAIECNGPGEKISVRSPGLQLTPIVLTKEEIDQTINTFASETKIPTEEGIYKVAAGNLILSAIISQEVGSKFIIRKIITPKYF